MTLRGAVVSLVAVACAGAAAATDSPRQTIAGAARKVVKIYGAGGVRGLEAYQSGLLVSPAGRIVTVASTVLDSPAIDCVLDDGRRFAATVVGIDPGRDLAVLSIDAEGLPCFALAADPRVAAGTRVMALANLFGVAVGDERVSVQRGVIAALVPLEARRGAAESLYKGDAYVLDFTTNNPGSAGGAVVDAEGRLLGMLGKELRSAATGLWLNHALPADEIVDGCKVIEAGGPPPVAAARGPEFDPRAFGIVLVPDLLDGTPPFVESVVGESAAARGGLRPDDLVIAVNGRTVTSRAAVRRALGGLAPGDPVTVTVVRGDEAVACDLGPLPRAEGRR
jgi:S1-C subfamily serine protease